VDQGIDRTTLGQEGDRLAHAILQAGKEVPLRELQRFVAALAEAERLTTSFRFAGGATRLDPQSAGNVRRLAQAIDSGVFDGKELVFVGFSDGKGPAQRNHGISRQRADAVRAAVQEELRGPVTDRVRLSVEAFGEALPLACDDSSWGRRVNRRVEVWLR
jgi:phosphate transport system substrate-binding protein